jgi:nucleotide-binding universal stress UspA family protein
MKTILCPVDSSPSSYRLVQYVGDLAKDLQAKVFLVAAQPTKRKALALAGLQDKSDHTHIDELHDYLSGIRHIPGGVEQEGLEGKTYKKLGEMADRYDLLVMTNDPSNKHGLDLTKTITATLVPLMVIPSEFRYRKNQRLLYAYDYQNEPEPPLVQLHWLADWFEADVRFLTVLPRHSKEEENEGLIAVQKRIANSWKGKRQVSFETTVYPDVPRGLENYVSLREQSDLLVLSVNHHNVLERIWHKSVVKELLHYTRHPYLIIHK